MDRPLCSRGQAVVAIQLAPGHGDGAFVPVFLPFPRPLPLDVV